MLTSLSVKAHAAELGFDLCGIAAARDYAELAFLPDWLSRGFAGRMTSLNRTAARRADVRRWLPSARSVIVVACSCLTAGSSGVGGEPLVRGRVARYARGDDYHTVMGQRLEALAAWIRAESGPETGLRWSVDAGPVQEKVYARHAGIGWMGKHTCVINPRFGSWIALGLLACELDLAPDAPVEDRCGDCRLCMDACPAGAIVEPGVLDARRCLAYLNVELRGSIPEAQRRSLGDHLFGCDACQDVCPHNATAEQVARERWHPRPELERAVLAELWEATDADLERIIGGTPVTRVGVNGLRRNLAVAIGNTGARVALPPEPPRT